MDYTNPKLNRKGMVNMKQNNGIVTLIERAMNRADKSRDNVGHATINRRERYNSFNYSYVGEMQEVYRTVYARGGLGGDTAYLYHYGTLTAEVWLADTPQVMHVYGESRSDADSINVFLNYFGIEERYTYRPVNGGFLKVEAK